VTYYRRGTIQSLLSLQAVDDDGNVASASTVKKQPISDDKFKRALKAIKDGSYSIKQLRESFELTKSQEEQI
jgi:hydrogenase maturation factor